MHQLNYLNNELKHYGKQKSNNITVSGAKCLNRECLSVALQFRGKALDAVLLPLDTCITLISIQ